MLASGVDGGSKAVIVDIGHVQVKPTYHSALWHLTRKGNVFSVPEGVTTPSQSVDFSTQHLVSNATVPLKIGHTYLLKRTELGSTDPLYVAMNVIDHEPLRSVTIRWRELLD